MDSLTPVVAESPAGPPPQAESASAKGRMPLLVLAAVLALPGLFMGLHADDWFQTRPRAVTEVLRTFAGDWGDGVQGRGGFYRPLVRVAFHFDQVLHGSTAFGCHLTNGVMFVALVWILFELGMLLTGGRTRGLLVGIGAVFLLSPLKNESLYWVSGRTDLLAALLVLGSCLLALRGLAENRALYAALALVALLGALLAKEVALSGALIIPLAALLLAPRETLREVRWILVVGPIVLGGVYFAYRARVLGGLAGYAEQGAPLAPEQVLDHMLRMLSALFVPWQAGGASRFAPVLGLLGFLLGLVLLLLGGCRRASLFALGSLVMAMLPMGLIEISPNDGTRVLLLPLCFQTLLFLTFFLHGGAWAVWRWIGGFLALVIALTLQPANLGMIAGMLSARRANDRVVSEAVSALHAATPGTVFIVPEGRPTHARRILDPGAALIMALQTRWLQDGGTGTESVISPDVPRVGIRLTGTQGDVFLAPILQRWMDLPLVLFSIDNGGSLSQLNAERVWAEDELTTSTFALEMPRVAAGRIFLIEEVVEPPRVPPSQVAVSTSGEGERWLTPASVVLGARRVSWWTINLMSGSPARTVRVETPPVDSTRSRMLRTAMYDLNAPSAEGGGIH